MMRLLWLLQSAERRCDMAVFKDKGSVYNGNKWRVLCYYTDWRGERIRHEKRGFETRREAVEYEHNFLAKQTKDINMSFSAYIDTYLRDMKPQIKKSTYANKEKIIDKHIRPFFQNPASPDISTKTRFHSEFFYFLLSVFVNLGKGLFWTYLTSY